MKRSIALYLTLFLAWLLWSGIYQPLLISLGLGSCLLVVLIMRHLRAVDDESVPLEVLRRILWYWAWLLKEIIQANIQVIRIVIDPKLPISPRVIELHTGSRSEMLNVIYGNSITLTPGSTTIDMQEDTLLVHCLTKEGAQQLQAEQMLRHVKKLEHR